jgi:hypothetical protein
VSLQAEQNIILDHPLTVIDDADEPGATAFYFDLYTISTGIKAVLKELFHHRGRALHDFTCRYLVGQLFRQDTDFRHKNID